ncbi:O-antigen polymerase [Halothece sp. PCC 7418]|uniref:O-antigen ligase family protein n=1 Tax=Halothece sp. (strain PCC 7418) TaxID=65093 RepID=UPI0002A0613D|nr:O-antigen ligase family protein [Halothece sp. PCC 7418]AFZ43552.1 O-antigen polymerase [Halothece sp. PCC 7418]
MLFSQQYPRLWLWGQRFFFILPLQPTIGSLGLLAIALLAIQTAPRELLKRPFNWGLFALTAWLLLTATTAEYQTEAWLGLANFIPFFLIFVGFNLLIETPRQLRRLAELGVISAVMVAVIGIGQIALSWQTPEALQPLLGWVLDPRGNPSGRLASVFMYANIAGAYLLIMFTLALGLWVECYRFHRQQVWRWLGLTVSLILIAIALFLTSSRNAWAVGFLVTVVYVIYLCWYWLLAVAAVILTAILGAAFAPPPLNQGLRVMIPRSIWARLNDQMYRDRATETLRTTQWQFTWDLMQDRPFLGWGLRNFTPLYQDQMGIWLGHPHNFPLMLSAEIGIPGLLLLLGLIGSAIVRGSILVSIWSHLMPTPNSQEWKQNQLIFLSFIIAFCALSLFNLLDITLFDLRLNLLAWLLLAGINGVSHHYRHLQLGFKLMR